MYQTLHCHTKTSDGELSHREVLDVCAEHNISVVAFTDHDALPSEAAVRELQSSKDHPTKWIIGCEISSGWPKEIGGIGSNFHIVGLFVNPFSRALVERNYKAQQARVERMERMVKNLRNLGFTVSADDCLKESGGEAVGRPHIVAALKKGEHNIKIIEDLRKKMAKNAKGNPTLKEKYEKMMERGEEQYPYVLFLDSEAYIPGIYVDYLYYTDMDESVRLIRSAGGVAILAHWTFSKNKVGQKMIEGFFRDDRLDGAEAVFGLGVTERLEEVKQDMETVRQLTEKYSKLQSGGADAHRKEDFEYFAQQEWFARKTIGLVERMMEMRDLNLEWSSLPTTNRS